jgi:hypothetical protein
VQRCQRDGCLRKQNKNTFHVIWQQRFSLQKRKLQFRKEKSIKLSVEFHEKCHEGFSRQAVFNETLNPLHHTYLEWGSVQGAFGFHQNPHFPLNRHHKISKYLILTRIELKMYIEMKSSESA